MKKFMFILSILLLSIATVHAQLSLKALIGTNLSTLTDTETDVSAKAGFQFGGSLLIGNKFYVEPGLLFVRNIKTFDYSTGDVTFKQDFVKIPVYAGYHILGSQNDIFTLRLFGGPSLSIPGKIGGGEHNISKDDIKDALWALNVGAGLDILFLFVELNYEHTLTKYFSDETLDTKKRSFFINAGIHIDF